MKGKLTRLRIIQTLVEALKPLDFVHALYEGGSAAFNRVDEWSDIDLYAVVDDGKMKDTFSEIEKALESLSPIAQKLEIPQLPWPGVSQVFYKLKVTSQYLLIDFAVLENSSPEKFLEPQIHGNAVFYFSKRGKIHIPSFDMVEFRRKMLERRLKLKTRFELFNIFVQKEINRSNNIQAIELYRSLTLAALVEALRMKYGPLHYDFKTSYVYHELPAETVSSLEKLYFVKDPDDLKRKYRKATKWFEEAISETSG
jgi:predicted nucleotidyltransferase